MTLKSTLPFILPLLALPLARKFKGSEIDFLVTLILCLFLLGKNYYFSALLICCVYFYEIGGKWSLKVNAYSFIFFFAALLIFPINKIVQLIENKTLILQENAVLKALDQLEYPSEVKLFVPPVLAERHLADPKTRLAIFNNGDKLWVTTDSFDVGDILVVTSENELQQAVIQFEGQIASVDTIIAGNRGALLLSSAYRKRKNGVNLYYVHF